MVPDETPKKFGLMVCPYLPLREQVRFGDYIVGPSSSLGDEWRDDDFLHVGTDVLKSYRGPRGGPLSDPSLIAHQEHGLDIPDAETALPSIQAALHFAVLDQNPDYNPKTQGWRIATSDNGTIHGWSLDAEGFVGTEHGIVVRKIDFGWKASDAEFEIPAPLHLHLPFKVTLQPDVLEHVFDAVRQAEDSNANVQPVVTAIRWLARAWTNSEAVGWDDRVVMLKTGFEALLGKSRNPAAMEALRSVFERCRDRHNDEMNAEALLWSPDEVERHTTTLDGVNRQLTDLEDWFLAFSRCRNKIIHQGRIDTIVYDVGSSAYNGPFPHVAERVLREAIKVVLDELGFGRLWESRTRRLIRQEVEKNWHRSMPE